MQMTLMVGGMHAATSSLALLQVSADDSHKLVIFAGIAAIALLVQALMMLGLAIGGLMAQRALKAEIVETKAMALKEIAEIKGKVMPLVGEAHALLTELSPEVRSISAKVGILTTNLEAISGTMKDKLQEFSPTITAARLTIEEANDTVRQANQKAQQQVSRVNGMVSDVLDATAQMGKTIQHGIDIPVREVSAILGGVKTGLLAFLAGPKRPKRLEYRGPIGTYEPGSSDTPDKLV